MPTAFPRVASFKTPEAFRERLAALNLKLDLDDEILPAPESPLAQPLEADGLTLGNRWVIHPMEGWDAGADGQPTDLVERRWENFGRSGAKWIWGGEAMSVVPEGRANPNQLVIQAATRDALARLHGKLVKTHEAEVGPADDLLTGFQLTHSGRFSRPFEQTKPQPQILYRHPVLDRKFGLADDHPLLTDDYIKRLIDAYIAAAKISQDCGAGFVDIKHCHGYLGHEFLSAFTRPGPYGGSFENRTRFLREIVGGIRATCPGLRIGVRFSAFDFIPFMPDPEQSEGTKLGPGIPMSLDGDGSYTSSFGTDPDNPTNYDLGPATEFLRLLESLDIRLINITAGSPYYVPHIQRPALFPPSDGYQPPEDPLIGVARQIEAVAELNKQFSHLTIVGSALTYLQEYLPHVAQWIVRSGSADAVGLGRMVLSYPTLPADTLAGQGLTTKRVCRTFSDCTTGPRNHMISGCFPLDPFYKAREEAKVVKKIRAGQ